MLRALLLLLLATPIAAQPARGEPRPWDFETSDIPVNERMRFGALDNGLRWAWMENPEPDRRCYLRLHVDVGSLAERDDERGMAHFLEHMAFNGTEHFAPGTLVEWFQEHGMAFGPDLNATTGFSETVYRLDLPESDAETVGEGLLVLRDFADRMLLEPEEVEAEIGVVDGEERERDSARFRVGIAALQLAYEGTRLAERIPIGEKEVRAAFDADSVRAFYERWYRPELMTLVVVGDLDGLDPVPLIEGHFADMPVPAGDPLAEPDRGTPTWAHRAFAIHSDELPRAEISIQRQRPWEAEPLTAAEAIEDLPLAYARAMLNLRYAERVKEEDAPFLGAAASSARAFEVVEGEAVGLACEPPRWREALAAVEQELRRALEHGFRQAELDEVRADALFRLDEAVEREATRSSRSFVGELLVAAESPSVPTSAATRRDLFAPAIEALTVEACHEAFAEAWSDGVLTIQCIGGLDLGEDAGDLLLAAYDESREVPVDAPDEIETAAFAYASDPDDAGTIVARRHVDDLDLHLVRFGNGVLLNVKATDFEEREVLLLVRAGEGQLTLAPERAALAWTASSVYTASGLGAHSTDELRRLTAGRQVGVGFAVADDHFAFSGATTPEDLLMQCELAAAYLTDPGWRPEGLRRFRQQIPTFYEGLEHQAFGPLRREFDRRLHGGDPRFGIPDREAVDAVTVDALRGWLGPALELAPIEVTVVGDVDVEAAIAAVARTFGALPPRVHGASYDERREVTPVAGLRFRATYESEVPQALVVVAYPTTDGIDAPRRRRMNLLGRVLSDRLRVHVREELGVAYSPGAGVDSSRVYPGLGFLVLQSAADPTEAEAVRDACMAAARAAAEQGITEEEVLRAREPLLKELRDQMRRNAFWLGLVRDAQTREAALDDVRAIEQHYRGVTAEQLTGLAREYVDDERASWAIVTPAPPADDRG